jgi:serine/threonine protein kinase
MAGDRVGQQLGNYRLLRLLGEGGFAEVFLGEHVYLNSQAAIKVLHTRLGQDDQEVFLSEARTIVRLKHPHIVRVLEFGIEGTTPFLVMDYAPQGTLRERHPRGTLVPLEVVQSYVRQVGEALHYAHEQKCIHRDIKPENMLLGERGEVVLSDFGIATIAQSTRYQQTEAVAGTAAYMAPEQFQGKPRPASDQYALGIVLYEWLTGTRPFHGSFLEISGQHLHVSPPRLREKLPDLPPAVEEVVLTALAKEPKERFATMQAFATAFEFACQESGVFFAPTLRSSTPPPSALPLSTPTPFSLSTPTPPAASHLPPTSAVAPVNRPPGDSSEPSSPDRISASQPAPPATRSLATPKPASLVRTQEQKQAKGGLSRRKVLVAGGTLVGVAAVGVSIPTLVIPLVRRATFHQEMTTSPQVPEIHVGTGYDASTSSIRGEQATFTVGEEVFVSYTVSTISTSDSLRPHIAVHLFRGDSLQATVSEFDDFQVTAFAAHDSSQTITQTGSYKWEIEYNGTPKASITFQVV